MSRDGYLPPGVEEYMLPGNTPEDLALEEAYQRQVGIFEDWLWETIEENTDIPLPCFKKAIEDMIEWKKAERRNITEADIWAEEDLGHPHEECGDR